MIAAFREYVAKHTGRRYSDAELQAALDRVGRQSESGDDVQALMEAKVKEGTAKTLVKQFPQGERVTRVNFGYRESADFDGRQPHAPRCQTCFHYSVEETIKDRLGTCGLFETLPRLDQSRFQLLPDVGAHAVCDAWDEEANAREVGIAAEALARHYADYWNHLKELGLEPTIDESHEVDDELDGSGWGINWSDGNWHVVEYPEQYYDQSEPRSPKGGVTVEGRAHRAGTWVPTNGDVPAEDKEKIAAAKREEVKKLIERQHRLSSTPVDRDDLEAKVALGGEADFSDPERRSIEYGYRALKRHHGEAVLKRLAQLINGVAERMTGVAAEQQKRLKRRLAAYKIMLERAEADFPVRGGEATQ